MVQGLTPVPGPIPVQLHCLVFRPDDVLEKEIPIAALSTPPTATHVSTPESGFPGLSSRLPGLIPIVEHHRQNPPNVPTVEHVRIARSPIFMRMSRGPVARGGRRGRGQRVFAVIGEANHIARI